MLKQKQCGNLIDGVRGEHGVVVRGAWRSG